MPKRRRRPGLIIVMVLAVVIAIGLELYSHVFVVHSVEVEGDLGAVSHESVVRAANVGFGESIFRVNEDEIASRINATGILKAGDVRVRYPDTVLVSVEQRSREAMVLHMGKMRVLDGEGYLVESLDQVPSEDIIYISGMRVQGCSTGEVIRVEEAQLAAYRQVIPAIRSHGASLYVSELEIGDVQNMRIITRNGIIVELGDMNNMQDKIAWMKSAVADLERRGETGGTLDVSSGTKADYRYSR